MARIVGGSMIGTLSGKMGGMVFSHNKSGPYVRQYVVPVNPNSGAQANARANFGQAVSNFHSLSGVEKSQWQNFAQTAFNPKNGINTGQFSSINAFTALKNMVQMGNSLERTATVNVNGTALVSQPSFTSISSNSLPPLFAVQPNLEEQTTGNPITFGNVNGGVATNGSFEVEIAINPGLTGAPTLVGFTNTIGQNLGFAVYCSEGRVQEGLFAVNPERYLLGYIPFNDADNTDLTAVTSIGFTSSTGLTTSNYQAFPTTGQCVNISVYIVDNDKGHMLCVGRKEDWVVTNTPY